MTTKTSNATTADRLTDYDLSDAPLAAHAAVAIDPEPGSDAGGFAAVLSETVGPIESPEGEPLMFGGYEPGPTIRELWNAKDRAHAAWQDAGGSVESGRERLAFHAYVAAYKRFAAGVASLPAGVLVEIDGWAYERDATGQSGLGIVWRRLVGPGEARARKEVANVG